MNTPEMMELNIAPLRDVVSRLCAPDSCKDVCRAPVHDQPMPSVPAITEIVERLRAVLFPGYYGDSEVTPESLSYHIGAGLDRVYRLVTEQIRRGYCFLCRINEEEDCGDCQDLAVDLATKFITTLPKIRGLLATDVQAALAGDPAAKTPGEIIFSYPSILALTHYRIAHELYHLGVDMIPRIICEMAHSKTGIDIHPGAEIGNHFFIDHGTGTVIGETSIIGDNVRLYQGVTLGAKSFPKDANGQIIKGLPRHPVLEDDVIIYSGATILGRVTIGKGSVIGGNVWVTESVPPGSRLIQQRPSSQLFSGGDGI
ncbi:serine O-acetyltransferase EpsC [Desulfonatronum lacustre]|uniref:serine O-acetyltransferase EpsC n=1 Tax=Desulfonatronum lacustre TaxID=66849 RepID=UPI001FE0C5E5|nr:serine O-acetyltransferase EpsC [Desulfonatronum lacustre]